MCNSVRGRNHGKVVNATEGLGLLIADEGHRLKNSSETKTTRALKACPAVMRLVLVRCWRRGCARLVVRSHRKV